MTADPARANQGQLVGVGVGPGDPGLVTRLAVSTLEGADRVTAPTTSPDSVGRAEAIVRQILPDLRIDRLPFDMTADRAPGGRDAREASRPPGARSAVMSKGSRSIRRSGRICRTMASARPTESGEVVGAVTRSAPSRVETANRVTRPGSPGPTPTPTSWPWLARAGSAVMAGSCYRLSHGASGPG